jgi:uncharacterized protein (TIGR03663 family)
MNKRAFAGLFLLVLIAGGALRLADLGIRPMHHDEANQALKFGTLLERGEYRYDKSDHHGPSLYYLSLPFARALGADTLAELSETTLRLVPACFGIGSILLLLLFVPLLGRETVLGSALALAVSPVMAYFSRFYIQETLLLFFLAGFVASLWRYKRRPSWPWALAAGVFAGMMYATKETSVIAFAAIAAAFIAASLFKGEKEKARAAGSRSIHLFIGLAAAFIVSFLLFTSFFQNPRGWLDSVLSFKFYFVRAGEAGFHIHPWNYYLRTLAFSKPGSGPVWSEAFLLILAAVGIVAAFGRRPKEAVGRAVKRFLVFYTLFSTAAYSLIPYKTPWNILPFYLGFVLLAGSGAAALLGAWRSRWIRTLVLLLMAAGFIHLGVQAWRAGFVFPADPRNPYVYAQTSPDFLKLVARVEELAAVHPDHEKMPIKVIAGPYETWPLPWYLRRFSRVGYWQEAAGAAPLDDAPVVITGTEQAGQPQSILALSYQSEYYGLRPNVLLLLHVRTDLWEEYLKSRAHE